MEELMFDYGSPVNVPKAPGIGPKNKKGV